MWDVLRNTEFSQIKPHHLRLDLHLIEFLARVDPNNTANHFRYHNHVSQMCLHQLRLLVGFGFLLGFAEFLYQTHGLTLETAVKPAAGTSMDDVSKLLGGEVEESDGGGGIVR